MNQTCGCCAGIENVTPQTEANRPGLSALSYRVGTYAAFFESMIARMSNLYLDVPTAPGSGTTERIYPLSRLTTRELSDPSIALLDAWAIVADVLTFYQERIANEGYLATATERRSILELARLVGYAPRPGVSASVYLAFTAAKGFNGTIPGGTRSQSIPGTGQTAQYFETTDDLDAQDVWNNLLPRLTRPQVITLNVDSGTDAATRDTLYFQGIATGLKSGDALLIVLGNGPDLQVLRFMDSVSVQTDQKRTEVTLQEPPPRQASSPGDTAQEALGPYIDQATSIFANTDLGGVVAGILGALVTNVKTAPDNATAANLVRAAIPQIQEQHDIAQKRSFTRLEPWTADILQVLNRLVPLLARLDSSSEGSGQPQFTGSALAASPLGSLFDIIEPLSKAPSLQPANSQRLLRSVKQTFASQADTAPRLLAAFKPAAATNLYQAWAGVDTPSPQPQVYAFRVKTGPYGHNAPQQFTVPAVGAVSKLSEWPAQEAGSLLSLDSTYDKIVPGSWMVVNSTDLPQPLIVQANSVQTISRSEYGIAARVTQVDIRANWFVASATNDISPLRRLTVWAQSDLLALAEEPLDSDIEKSTIDPPPATERETIG